MNLKKKKDFIKKHEYPGGVTALKQYFKENMKYPELALQNKIEGKVLIAYTIDFDGQVNTAKILKGIGYQCDEEALRLVKGMKFAPQNNHGVKISTSHKIKVEFKLPTMQIKKKSTSLKYHIVQTEVKNKQPEKKPISYNYTININS